MMKLQSEVSTKQTRRQLGDGGGTTKTQVTRVSNIQLNFASRHEIPVNVRHVKLQHL